MAIDSDKRVETTPPRPGPALVSVSRNQVDRANNRYASLPVAARPPAAALDTAATDRDFAMSWIEQHVGGSERRQVLVLAASIHLDELHRAALTPRLGLQHTLTAKQDVCSIIEKHGGYVIHRAGSAVLAVWGVQAAEKDDAHKAARAALMIAAQVPRPLLISVALAAGAVIAEEPTSAHPGTIDIDGPALVTAQAMLARCPVGHVFATAAVAALCREELALEANSGTDQTIGEPTYRVLGPLRTAQSTTMPPRLVGHDLAQKCVADCLASVLDGDRQTVLLRGEAGIGKTGLLAVSRTTFEAAGGVWIEAACLLETRNIPLHPVREALRKFLLGNPSNEQAEREVLMIQRLGATSWTTLTRFLRASPGGGAIDPRHTSKGEQRPMDILIAAVQLIAEQAPLAIVIEDLHWADSATSEFVQRIAQHLERPARLGLICTSREDLGSLCDRRFPVATVTLQRLCVAQVLEIVEAHPDGRALSAQSRAWIAERSEGVPLYALELIRLCSGTGSGLPTTGVMDGPSGLNAILVARLDQLGELKRLAQAASIFGREFDRAALAMMMDAAPSQLDASLQGLVEFGILETDRSDIDVGYRFTHSLLRDAAYATLLRGRRSQLHARAAAILASRFRNRAIGTPEQIAGHFTEAGDLHEAFVWWRQAGEAAIAISEIRGAITLLEAALDAAKVDPSAATAAERIAVLRLLALQLSLVRGNAANEVVDAYQRCLDLVERDDSIATAATFDILWGLHTCYLVRGDMRDALDIGHRLLAICEKEGSEAQRLLADRVHGLSLLLAGEPLDALTFYDRVLTRYRAKEHSKLRFAFGSDQRALALAHSSWACTVLGREADARQMAAAAHRIIEKIDHPHTTAHVVCILATAAQTAGHRETAAAMAAAGKVVAEANGFTYWSAWAALVLGWLEAKANPDLGLTMIADAILAYKETGASQALPYANMLYADAAIRAERPSIALSTVESAIVFAETRGLMLYVPELERLHGIALMTGRPSKSKLPRAREAIERALDLATAQRSQLFASRARTSFETLFGEPTEADLGRPRRLAKM